MLPLTLVAGLLGCGDDAVAPAADGAPLGDGSGTESGAVTPQSTQVVNFSREESPFKQASYDTGWQPASSPVQVRFTAVVAARVASSQTGTGALIRNGGLVLTYNGKDGEGQFSMDLGFEISGRMKINSPPTLVWEGPLPLHPQFDFRFKDEKKFTPFILEGAGSRPIHLEDKIDPVQLYTVPVPGLGLKIGSVELGGLVAIRANGILKADLSGTKITTTIGEGQTLVQQEDGQQVSVPEGKSSVEGQAAYQARVVYGGEIVLRPAITISTPIPGLTWDIAEFAIPIPLERLGNLEHDWSFDPQKLSLGAP